MKAAPAAAAQGWFISALGAAQICSWGTLFYGFPLIAEAMRSDLGWSKPTLYGAATLGMLLAGLAAYAVGAAIDRNQSFLCTISTSASWSFQRSTPTPRPGRDGSCSEDAIHRSLTHPELLRDTFRPYPRFVKRHNFCSHLLYPARCSRLCVAGDVDYSIDRAIAQPHRSSGFFPLFPLRYCARMSAERCLAALPNLSA